MEAEGPCFQEKMTGTDVPFPKAFSVGDLCRQRLDHWDHGGIFWPIGFVGRTIPHIARILVGGDYRGVLPWSALIAGISC